MNSTPAAGRIRISGKGKIVLAFLLLTAGSFLGTAELRAQANSSGLRLQADTIMRLGRPLRLSPLLIRGGDPFFCPPSLAQLLVQPEMPRVYSYDELGFFCKWEVQLEKAAQLPVKFRLGEVQYVERLEGKLPDISRPDYR